MERGDLTTCPWGPGKSGRAPPNSCQDGSVPNMLVRRARAARSEALLLSTGATGDRECHLSWIEKASVCVCEILDSPLDQGLLKSGSRGGKGRRGGVLRLLFQVSAYR